MNEAKAADLPEPPERVGPYRIEKRLGIGGMGEVYRAYDERLDRKVAIKHIHSENPKALQRLRREAKAAAGLNHPSIVQVYDILETVDGEWVVMELVDGMTLRDRVDRSQLPWPRAVALARQICAGLAVAHEQGIVHRDLKSENVMLTHAGRDTPVRAKILDFGLAKNLEKTEGEPELSIQGEIVGTVRAMSPEQARGEEIDHRSDLFSLGTLFYEMLTGKAPFRGSSMIHTLTQICAEPHVPVLEHRPDLPPELSQLVDDLLQKNPAHRPASAAEVAAALARVAEGSAQAFEPPAEDDSGPGAAAADSPPPGGTTFHSQASSYQPKVSDSSTTWLRPSFAGQSSRGVFVRTLLALELVDREVLLERHGDVAFRQIVARHDDACRELLAQFAGVEVDKGDYYLLLFERPVDSARFMLAYRQALAELAHDVEGGLEARAGIHLGEVFLLENTQADVTRGARPLEVEGLTRRIASRAMALARPGQTLITQAAYELARRALLSSEIEDGDLSWASYGEYRFEGVDETLSLFEIGLKDSSPMRPPPETPEAHRLSGETSAVMNLRRLSWRRALPLAAVLAVALLLVYRLLLPAGGAGRGPQSVAVLGFKNLTGDSETAWISTALAELLSSELAVGTDLQMVPGESIARMKRELALSEAATLAPETLSRVRKNLGTDFVVLGSYAIAGAPPQRLLRVQLHLQGTRQGDTLASFQETGSEEELFELVSELGTDLRDRLGLGARTREDVEAVRATVSSSPQATRLYAQGLERLRSFDALAARDLLTQAIEQDEGYALAHAALSETLLELGRDAEAAERARIASELAEGLPRGEVLQIEALYHESSGNWERAVETRNALARFFPLDVEHGLRLAHAQTEAGRHQDALATVEQLRQLPPPASDDPRIDLAEGWAAFWSSDYERQLDAAERALAKARDMEASLLLAESLFQQGRALYYLSRMTQAEEALEQAEQRFRAGGDRDKVGQVLVAAGLVAHWLGDLAKAERLYRQALDIHRQIGNRKETASALNLVAYLTHERGELATARSHVEEALATVRELGDRNRESSYLDTLTWVVLKQDPVEAQELARAEQRLNEEIGAADGQVWGYCYEARGAVATGELARARELYDKARALNEEVGIGTLTSFLLFGLGDLLLTEGDLDGARAAFDEAFEIRRGLDDRESLAESELSHAQFLLVLDEVEEAAAVASDIERVFRTEGRMDSAILAAAVAAEARLKMDDAAAARQALGRVQAAAAASQNPRVRLTVAITAARVTAAEGDVQGALDDLETARAAAVERRLRSLELEARLTMGQIELAAGRAEGRGRLARLAAEARESGFGWIARRADG